MGWPEGLLLGRARQHDWNFHKMIGYVLRLDCSVKDDNGEPTMSPMKSDGTVKFSVTKPVPLFSYWFFDFVYNVMSPTFKAILNVLTAKELDAFSAEACSKNEL